MNSVHRLDITKVIWQTKEYEPAKNIAMNIYHLDSLVLEFLRMARIEFHVE